MAPSYKICAPLNNGAVPVLQVIETASTFQIPGFHVVGLPSQEISEARERVRAAIEASGLEFPRRRVVLNLSPASIRKQGTGLELAMALAVLASEDRIERGGICVACGELSLDGKLRSTGQVLRALYAAWKAESELLIIPAQSRDETSRMLGLLILNRELVGQPPRILAVKDLKEAWSALKDPEKFEQIRPTSEVETERDPGASLLPLSPSLSRTLGIAAAGKHHLLLIGPRGTGKSHSLEWLIGLQPPAAPRVQLKHALMAELRESDQRQDTEISSRIPVRRVGLNTRASALTGTVTSSLIRPGEFSLAHGGLLIADELPEWPRDAREALREPLERGWVSLSRANGNVELPARFVLASTGNICPCGGWPAEMAGGGGNGARCRCTRRAKELYAQRLSGPILDRMDLVIQVFQPPLQSQKGQLFSEVKTRVIATRRRALERYDCLPGEMDAAELEQRIGHLEGFRQMLRSGCVVSLRSRHKIGRIALTLSCWDDTEEPTDAHWLEAARYRPEAIGLI